MILEASSSFLARQEGQLSAYKGERFLLLDEVCGHFSAKKNFVISAVGNVGWIPSYLLSTLKEDQKKELKFVEELIQTIQRKRKTVTLKNSVRDNLFESLLLQNLQAVYSKCSRLLPYDVQEFPAGECKASRFSALLNDFVADLTTQCGFTKDQAVTALQAASRTVLKKHPFSVELTTYIDAYARGDQLTFGEEENLPQEAGDSTDASLTPEENDLVRMFHCTLKKCSQQYGNGITYDAVKCLRILESMLRRYSAEEIEHVIHKWGPERVTRFMNVITQDLQPNRVADVINIAEQLCEKYPATARRLADSNLPNVLMKGISDDRIESGLLMACVNCLNMMVSAYNSYSSPPSTEIQEYLRSHFIPWLFKILGQNRSGRNQQTFLFFDLALGLCSIESVRKDFVEAVCSTSTSCHFLGYLMAIIGNAGDEAIQLPLEILVDILSYSSSKDFLSPGFVEYLINLTERKIKFYKEFTKVSEWWLRLLKAICNFVTTLHISDHCQKLLESSIGKALDWNDLPDYEKKCICDVDKALYPQEELEAQLLPETDIEPPFTQTIVIKTSTQTVSCKPHEVLFQVQLLRLLEELVSKLRILERGDLTNLNWLNSKMTDILEYLKHFTKPHTGFSGVELRVFKFDVREISFAVDYLNSVFIQVRDRTARTLVLMTFLEMCHVFPAVIPFVLEKELIICVMNSIGSYLNEDGEMFRLSASLMSRLFSTGHQPPDTVIGLVNKDLLKTLVDKTELQETKEDASNVELALTFILAANLHFTDDSNSIVKALSDHPCRRTLETYTSWLKKNFDPIDNFDYLQHHSIPNIVYEQETTSPNERYALLKFYSGLLKEDRAAYLLNTKDFVALINFISKRLLAMSHPLVHKVPELFLRYVTDILKHLNALVIKKKHNGCDQLQKVIQKLEGQVGSVEELDKLLLSARMQLQSSTRNMDLTSQSVCHINDVKPSTVKSMFKSLSEVIFNPLRNFTTESNNEI